MGRFSDAQLDLVRQRADIISVIGERVTLQKKGRDFVACCPFHEEKTPSFFVNPQKQAWYCHGSCKKGGDVFTFVRDIDRVSFREAVRLVARRFGVDVEEESPEDRARAKHRADLLDVLNRTQDFYKRKLWSNDPAAVRAREFLTRRGVTEDTAKEFGLGVAPAATNGGSGVLARKASEVPGMLPLLQELGLVQRNGRDFFQDRLMFPIGDESGRCVGFGGRVLGEATKFEPKFKNSTETPGIFEKKRLLYGLDKTRHGKLPEQLVIVEGYLDVVIAHQAGCKNVVAALGVGFSTHQGFSVHHSSLVRRFATEKSLVLLLDGDNAGRDATQRILEDLLSEQNLDAKVASLPEGQDPDDYVLKHGKEGFESFVREQSRDAFRFLVDHLVPEGATVTRQMVARCAELLGKFKDEIRYRLALKYASERLRYSEEGLANEVKKIQSELRARDERMRAPELEREAQRARVASELADPQVLAILGPHACAGEAFEITLLEALIARPHAANGAAAEIHADDFTRGPLREIASVVLRLARDRGNELGSEGSEGRDETFMNRVLEQIGDGGAAPGVLSRLLARIHAHPETHYEAELQGVATLVARRNRRRVEELRREIEQASGKGDWALLERLLGEKTRLERETDAARRARRD